MASFLYIFICETSNLYKTCIYVDFYFNTDQRQAQIFFPLFFSSFFFFGVGGGGGGGGGYLVMVVRGKSCLKVQLVL